MATCLFRFLFLCVNRQPLRRKLNWNTRCSALLDVGMADVGCKLPAVWMICRSYGTCLRPPTKNSLFYVSFGFPTNLNCTLVPWVGAGPKLNLLGFERNTTHWMLQVIQVIRCCCLPAVLWRFQISWGFP